MFGVGSGEHQAECEQTIDKVNCTLGYVRGIAAKVKGNYSSLQSAVGRPSCWVVISQMKSAAAWSNCKEDRAKHISLVANDVDKEQQPHIRPPEIQDGHFQDEMLLHPSVVQS